MNQIPEQVTVLLYREKTSPGWWLLWALSYGDRTHSIKTRLTHEDDERAHNDVEHVVIASSEHDGRSCRYPSHAPPVQPERSIMEAASLAIAGAWGVLFAVGLLVMRIVRRVERIDQEVQPLMRHLDSIGADAARAPYAYATKCSARRACVAPCPRAPALRCPCGR